MFVRQKIEAVWGREVVLVFEHEGKMKMEVSILVMLLAYRAPMNVLRPFLQESIPNYFLGYVALREGQEESFGGQPER